MKASKSQKVFFVDFLKIIDIWESENIICVSIFSFFQYIKAFYTCATLKKKMLLLNANRFDYKKYLNYLYNKN